MKRLLLTAVAVIAILIAIQTTQAHAVLYAESFEHLERISCFIYNVAKHAETTYFEKEKAELGDTAGFIAATEGTKGMADALAIRFGDISLHTEKVSNMLSQGAGIKISRRINYESALYNAMSLLKSLTLQERIKLFLAIVCYKSEELTKLYSIVTGKNENMLAHAFAKGDRNSVEQYPHLEFLFQAFMWLNDEPLGVIKNKDAVLTTQKAELIWAMLTGNIVETRRMLSSLDSEYDDAVQTILNTIAKINPAACLW